MTTAKLVPVSRSFLTAAGVAAAIAIHTSAAPAGSAAPRASAQIPAAIVRIEPLFAPASPTTQASKETDDRVLRRAKLTISDRTIASGVIANADAHLLNVFADVRVVAFRSRVETRLHGDYSWFGTIPGDEFGRAIITVVGKKLGAYVATKGRYFMVLPVERKLYEAIEIDASPFPEGKIGPIRDVRVTGGRPSRTPRVLGTGPLDDAGLIRWFGWEFSFHDPDDEFPIGPVSDDGSVIDILVYYSHGAAVRTDLHTGSVVHGAPHRPPANLLARIQTGIDVANQSLWDSGVATHFNLLWNTAQENVDLIDSGDAEDDVEAWGTLASVTTARDVLAADIVVFVTGSSLTGGHTADTGFTVAEAKARPNVFGHELGHSMGLEHDWDTCLARGDCVIPGDWSIAHQGQHGYVQVSGGIGGSAVRSMMAYATTCTILSIPTESCIWAARWSNPVHTQNGLPFGRPEGVPYPANEVGTLNDGRLFGIANRRQSACRAIALC